MNDEQTKKHSATQKSKWSKARSKTRFNVGIRKRQSAVHLKKGESGEFFNIMNFVWFYVHIIGQAAQLGCGTGIAQLGASSACCMAGPSSNLGSSP